MKSVKIIPFIIVAVAAVSCKKANLSDPSVPEFAGVIETSQEVDLGLSVKWAGYNVGSTAPENLGEYYACGEDSTRVCYSKKDYVVAPGDTCWGYNSTTSKFDTPTEVWGVGWSFPTAGQVQELIDSCTVQYCKYKDVVGYAVTGPNGKSIFFPASGYKAELNTCNAGTPTYQATYWYSEKGTLIYFGKKYVQNEQGGADIKYVIVKSSSTNLYLGRPIRAVHQ